jgi:RNA polymerase sigma-70 factor (ECF subfamily)
MNEGTPSSGDGLAEARRDRLVPESSIELLRRAKEGDRVALNRLCERYLPPLRRWATGRLPRWARDLRDTEDLVQETIAGVLPRLEVFEFRHDGALHAFLRHALLNRIRQEVRNTGRRPKRSDLEIEPVDPEPSPLENVIGKEAVERYEEAMKRLSADDQALIVARIEMHASFEQIAAAFQKPSFDAARMAVSRALVCLAKELRRDR